MNAIFEPQSRPLISDSISELLSDNIEEDQAYEEKPNDSPWYWYTDLANYLSALYDHWSTKDVYKLLKRPEFQFCDGSVILEDSQGYWDHQREEIISTKSAATAIFSPNTAPWQPRPMSR